MKVGYVKIRKRKVGKNKILNIWELVKYKFYDLLNIVEQDKYYKNIFRVTNFTKKSKEKLIEKIKKESIDYVITEENKIIPYVQLDGRCEMKYMVPEIIDFCYRAMEPEIDEIHICTNIFSNDNVSLIKELTTKVKVVNIITSNRSYYRLEANLEREGIYITVSSNKRKCLKNATITVNLDFNNLNGYNINRNMAIIDVTGLMDTPKGFNGVIIKRIDVNTKRVLRVFSEFDGFERSKLIEAEMLKLGDYTKARNYIHMGGIYISNLYSKRKITAQNLKRLRTKPKSYK